MTKDRSHIKSISQIPFQKDFLCTKTLKITYVRLDVMLCWINQTHHAEEKYVTKHTAEEAKNR